MSSRLVRTTGAQRRQGCQANATPAQWCDSPGRGLAPTVYLPTYLQHRYFPQVSGWMLTSHRELIRVLALYTEFRRGLRMSTYGSVNLDPVGDALACLVFLASDMDLHYGAAG